MPRILAQVVDSLNKLEASVREEHREVSFSLLTEWPFQSLHRLEWRS